MPDIAFPYPGNKARHAEWILKHLPGHTCYVEPFGGAAGVLFNKSRSTVEVYNDIDEDIVHFFRVLRERPDELTDWLERTPYARAIHNEWKDAFYSGERPDDDIERAGRFFFLRYAQFGGKYYGTGGFAYSTSDNRSRQYRDKTEALETFSDRLKGVIIECEPWERLFERYDGPDTVFYCDPPYMGSEYQYGSEFDHKRLYKMADAVDGKCLISYDDVPKWYDGFHAVSKESSYHIDNAEKGEAKSVEEVLLMNYDPEQVPMFAGAAQSTLTDGGFDV